MQTTDCSNYTDLETTGRKELIRWVLSWMPDVKVLAPKKRRDRIAGKLRDGLRTQRQDRIAQPSGMLIRVVRKESYMQ